jgi:hypothetical protein
MCKKVNSFFFENLPCTRGRFPQLLLPPQPNSIHTIACCNVSGGGDCSGSATEGGGGGASIVGIFFGWKLELRISEKNLT